MKSGIKSGNLLANDDMLKIIEDRLAPLIPGGN